MRREPISPEHDTDTFDSGKPELDMWLSSSAMQAERMRTARTIVWCEDDDVVVAYHSLAAHRIEREVLPAKIARGAPTVIPSILLAKLALDQRLQGKGLGAALLQDAFQRVVAVGLHVGVRLLVVDAIDESAAAFYLKNGFVPTSDPFRLVRKISGLATEPAG